MKIWWALIPLGIYYIVNNTFVLLGMSLLEKAVQSLNADREILLIYLQTAIKMTGVALSGLAVFPFYKQERILSETEAESKQFKLKEISGLLLLGSVLGIGFNFLFQVLGFTQSSETYKTVAESQFRVPLWLAFCFYGILSPVVEEIVFRGVIYRFFRRNTGRVAAVLGSALLFGAIHGNIVQMVYGGIMGSIFALYYEKYGKIAVPVLLHGAANVSVYLLYYISAMWLSGIVN